MSRLLLVLLLLTATAGAVVAYRDPEQVARASDTVSDFLRHRTSVKLRRACVRRSGRRREPRAR